MRTTTQTLAYAVLCITISIIIYMMYNIKSPSHKRAQLIHSDSTKHDKLKIAIIGSYGYVGSKLFHNWQVEDHWFVTGYDRVFPGKASYELSAKTIRQYDVIVYLGGLTGRKMCLQRPGDIEQENIQDIHNLAKQMSAKQLLLFASTSAILEGSANQPAKEDFRVRQELLDLYAASLFHREKVLEKFSTSSTNAPRMIGLRFGTVIGVSPIQRNDLAHMALICQAFLGGRLRVTHPESYRGFLSIDDLVRALTRIIKHSEKLKRFDIFHLQSFATSISQVANSIASRTGAHVHVTDHPAQQDSPGFSLDTNKFRTLFNFTFEDDQPNVISKLLGDIPHVCVGRQSRVDPDSVECKVCGSKTMHTVLDLHTQPLANDFRNSTESSLKCERFPLRLVRCPKCHHTQLSYIVDREYLFSHYLYQSGTSKSLKDYFGWLADKVINETGQTNGSVLEIACNDGTQLNQFMKRGWTTFGVDPARNLAELARQQGHTVFTGFWGKDKFPELPEPSSLDAIVAQNVFAHVDNPVEFLQGCANVMGEQTKLYIQTSQCEMFETGQFDTIYHEHISFFTAHSFKKIADIVGLTIVNFEITPIHGRSCLVTFKKPDKSVSTKNVSLDIVKNSAIAVAIEKERLLGMTETWFYVQYESRAQAVRQWMVKQLDKLHDQGHAIVGYGAAAKGMVLLHYLLEVKERSWNIAYVVDDAPLKQNTFCPGTTIPVMPTGYVQAHARDERITIIIFAWNFWEEIANKIRSLTIDVGYETVFILIPFPKQQLIKLESNSTNRVLTESGYRQVPWPIRGMPNNRSLVLVAHFYNEEFLLPHWIRHHASMFDKAVLINYNSTDKSIEIIHREAPETWRIVESRNSQFQADAVDAEVMEQEQLYPNDWKVSLNIPEFFIHPDVRVELAETEKRTGVSRIPEISLVGEDCSKLQRFQSLVTQRTEYVCSSDPSVSVFAMNIYSRFIHCLPVIVYGLGRHNVLNSGYDWIPNGFIAKFSLTPWPGIINRKLQIRNRIPANDFALGRGFQHDVSKTGLYKIRQQILSLQRCNLQDYTASSQEEQMMHRLWSMMYDF